ncbi:MAG: DUF5702 domain-containing protein [Lachnospiraceae bacterium]|nr:DUF5702 domain-containing protein [Lachnospiraceae bacterium]
MVRAEISIFMALILSLICIFILSLIESARFELIKYEMELKSDLALRSCFGEYSRELFEEFDLLYIDSSYRYGKGDIAYLEDHLKDYTDINLKSKKSDFLRLKLNSLKIEDYLPASGKEGTAMKNQAVYYIKNYGKEKYRSKLKEYISVMEDQEEDFIEQWDMHLNNGITGEGKTNPALEVRNRLVSTNQLLNGSYIYMKVLPYKDLPSKRKLNEGSYPEDKCREEEDDGYFEEYLMQKLGCYTEYDGDQALRCELEYMIAGGLKDKENMNYIVGELLSHRESVNLNLIKNDPYLRDKALDLAYEYVHVEYPESVYEIRDSLIYAWAYGQACIDVNSLLCKGYVEADPARDDITLPLGDIRNFRNYMGKGIGHGLSYKEYLGIMLLNTDRRKKKMRFMDVVEMDMRRKENTDFRIDNCFEYVKASMNYESGFGYSKVVERDFEY